ncbi:MULTISPECIES: GIY-YIG nuclease family protein [Gluconobacter]|uniref:hypothetical protein n=1 Tax=Gluconobacter TaxID=441 RepID=UPI00098AEE25|nr:MULTISPECIES: hypothetical protein [Gluconobacter]MBF0891710.1 hypothetical protein [Gluconobacter cadivus]MBS1053800.1 hypothetical protein [Gluconobacter kondonii]MBS1057611.1 hypothetical protein [Gluconobacter kondonii]MCP1237492.1 hypothetical protein [Gluconobacter kondonii]
MPILDLLKTQIKRSPKNRQSNRQKPEIRTKAHQPTVLRSLHLRTASRIREAVLERLSHSTDVDIYVIVPEDPLWLNGVLPVDPVAGLEEGLIRTFKPKWNRRGCGAE